MEIAFATKALRELCENATAAERQLGEPVARKLRARLADLRAAETVNDLLAGRSGVADESKSNHIAIRLCEDYSMTVCPNHQEVPLLRSKGVAWSSVHRVKIIKIAKKS